jgi:hypothetical protein
VTLRTDAHQREIRAARPGPDAESLRRAYLELLKVSLTDLAGAETLSVEFLVGGRVYSRRLPREHLAPRVDGRDWPFGGLSMAGLKRLDDLQGCVETLVTDGIEGDLIEAGTWRGGTSVLMRATLDTLGARDRDVWVADSFQGFPGAGDGPVVDPDAEEMSMLEFLSVPVEEVKASFDRLGLGEGVRFLPGFFAQTMPRLRGRQWSLVRLDGDSYEATMDCLNALYPGLAKGGYLVVDDYGAIEVCRTAVDDFRREHGIEEPLEQVDWTCVRWRRESQPEAASASAEEAGTAEEIPPAALAGTRKRIPDIHELQLENEIAELRGGR